ncbi:bifunctional diaminohydroxyphosphoribosylaminopyrimidine deaminase/5-amino-6-(5-phosphoribosylamino)uracil reductase RibD [Limibaculum sp. FT325]|uniref:bifunctional diaminohydroxyphosphoribosylaminopyrimidine deaminase/5-amino-6-(5-phosphoribosylamino)uracil reductase RibD n=1 Tax=Thermohalobaculum sediminis TaxID=2939436 RepID=UPI0020C1877B|nr:bifunctional diaminohydroxyphosphoribosylaminopyrimidine deaminase/5-amino-6-(5-phosphoribosylamino)uracil reductase RibD [Limibaculum sediminis]MCL5778563.1 bifunctional diaminohydroxyphosphoribosylaminopyrimidine deaminase/5-amino-6-(5-phosphoribosylamino)uracil reductase RibD [Limibaculum sediminis]
MGGSAAAEDRRWMAMALGLARRGLGRVAPNPAVAALIVREGRLLGRGVTAPGGRPHAEALALEAAEHLGGPGAARGATAYVTLEPCAHHGLTPPCAEALVAAGIARLVCPLGDPDPRVAGRGFARLREAGVAVETGLMAAEAAALNKGFLGRIERGRPHLTLKLAASLDGRIATEAGESRWITGPEARLRVHGLRAQSDGILIGAGTARADDPMLDVRGFGAGAPRPVRVVLDAALTLPLESRLATSATRHPLWLLHRADAEAGRQQALSAAGARLIRVPGEGRMIDPAAALQALAGAGLTRVLCEGGGRLAASLLGAGLVDELWLFTAGKAIGAEGAAAVGPLALGRLGEAPRLALERFERVGGDCLSVWRRG